jgi:hypothetical protein
MTLLPRRWRQAETPAVKKWLTEHEEHDLVPVDDIEQGRQGFFCLECGQHRTLPTAVVEKDRRIRAALRFAAEKADAKIIRRGIRSPFVRDEEPEVFASLIFESFAASVPVGDSVLPAVKSA